METSFLTLHPFTYYDNGQSYDLPVWRKQAIAIATLVGLLFFGIGAPIVFLISSYRHRVEEATEQNRLTRLRAFEKVYGPPHQRHARKPDFYNQDKA